MVGTRDIVFCHIIVFMQHFIVLNKFSLILLTYKMETRNEGWGPEEGPVLANSSSSLIW